MRPLRRILLAQQSSCMHSHQPNALPDFGSKLLDVPLLPLPFLAVLPADVGAYGLESRLLDREIRLNLAQFSQEPLVFQDQGLIEGKLFVVTVDDLSRDVQIAKTDMVEPL